MYGTCARLGSLGIYSQILSNILLQSSIDGSHWNAKAWGSRVEFICVAWHPSPSPMACISDMATVCVHVWNMAGTFLRTNASRFVSHSQKLIISGEFGTRALDLFTCSASRLFRPVRAASIAVSRTKITICLAGRIISSLYYINDWKVDKGHMELHAVCSEATVQACLFVVAVHTHTQLCLLTKEHHIALNQCHSDRFVWNSFGEC